MPPPQQKQEVDGTICPRRQTWLTARAAKPVDKVNTLRRDTRVDGCVCCSAKWRRSAVHPSYCTALNITYRVSQSVFLQRNLSVPRLRWISLSGNRYLQPASLFLICNQSAVCWFWEKYTLIFLCGGGEQKWCEGNVVNNNDAEAVVKSKGIKSALFSGYAVSSVRTGLCSTQQTKWNIEKCCFPWQQLTEQTQIRSSSRL